MRKVFFFLTLYMSLIVMAQESEDKTEQPETPASVVSDDTNSDDKEKETETPDTFDPTEKLSEDIAADFPIDI